MLRSQVSDPGGEHGKKAISEKASGACHLGIARIGSIIGGLAAPRGRDDQQPEGTKEKKKGKI